METTTDAIKRMGVLITSLKPLSLVAISEPSFNREGVSNFVQDGIKKAIEDAKMKAKFLAEAADVELGSALEVYINEVNGHPLPQSKGVIVTKGYKEDGSHLMSAGFDYHDTVVKVVYSCSVPSSK